MKQYEIKNNYSPPVNNIESIINNNLGPISEKSDSKYIITQPKYNVLEKVELQIDISKRKVYLNVKEKDLSYVKSNELLQTVPDVFKCKNRLLRKLTGKTVDDRKEKMKKDVLPHTELDIINT